jgi:hypothetical protein
MPLQFTSQPELGSELVADGIVRLATSNSFGSIPDVDAQTLKQKEPDGICAPHPLFNLDAADLANGEGLETASSDTFIYILESAGRPRGMATVRADSFGVAAALTSLSFGAYAQSASTALALLSSHEKIRKCTYEVRVLRVIMLHLWAIWLKSNRKKVPDIIYPLTPTPAPLEAGKLYEADEFMAIVRPIARSRMERSSEMLEG